MKRQEERIKVPCQNRKRKWHKTLVEEETNIGVLKNRDKSYGRSKSRGRITCFYYSGKPNHFQRNCEHFKQDKVIAIDLEPRKNSNGKNTSAIATSEEELLLICEQASVNLANVECSWVVDFGASFHLTPKRECFSSYTTDDYGYVRMGNDGE